MRYISSQETGSQQLPFTDFNWYAGEKIVYICLEMIHVSNKQSFMKININLWQTAIEITLFSTINE